MSYIRVLSAALAAALLLAVPAHAEKRVALVVGNSAYKQANPLANPVNDASEIASALKASGFDVILGVDLDKRTFDTKVRDFAELLESADVAIFFYAGHGLQVAGRNYLIPVDARLAGERDLDFDAENLDFILKQMELGRADKTNIVFLDACRDNPFAQNLARSMGTRSASIGKGLAQVDTGVGTFIAYSTQPGNVALDGKGKNSPFTAALAKHVREPGRDLTSVMIEVRKDVLAATDGKQVPWDHSALTGEFYFQPTAAQQRSATTAPNEAPSPAAPAQRNPEETANIVALAQARERLRQLEEENQADQQRIFDKQFETGSTEDTTSRNNAAMAIGKIQMQMVRRGMEQKKLREEITALEGKLGLPAEPEGGKR
ncbi:MAG TPA: caspase domain-containing protein [Hyphomicrobium sp.]|nr:caspase domain-containing protein [Hyphomicrobium sp.]